MKRAVIAGEVGEEGRGSLGGKSVYDAVVGSESQASEQVNTIMLMHALFRASCGSDGIVRR